MLRLWYGVSEVQLTAAKRHNTAHRACIRATEAGFFCGDRSPIHCRDGASAFTFQGNSAFMCGDFIEIYFYSKKYALRYILVVSPSPDRGVLTHASELILAHRIINYTVMFFYLYFYPAVTEVGYCFPLYVNT